MNKLQRKILQNTMRSCVQKGDYKKVGKIAERKGLSVKTVLKIIEG